MLRRFELFGVYGEVWVRNIDEAFVTRDNVLGRLNFGISFIYKLRTIARVHYLSQQ